MGTVGSSVSAKSLCPILFSAATLKKYSTPSVSLLILSDNVVPSTVLTGVHVERLASRFSMMYLVISLPPSELGDSHANVTEFFSTSLTLRFCGFDGLPSV